MASISGGIRVNGFIAPSDTNDTYPTHISIYGKGGHREVVTLVERDSIPDDRRIEGMTCFVSDSQLVYILKGGILNTDWQELAAGEKYTNAVATPETIGGIEVGSTFLNDSISSLFDRLLYPYQYPEFINVSTDLPENVEVGYTLSGNYTFTWSMTNPDNVLPNSIVISDANLSTQLITSLALSGTQIVNVGSIQNNIMATQTFTLSAENTKFTFATYDVDVSWGYRYYFGESTSLTINETELLALRDSFISQTLSENDFPFIALPGYKYVCHEATLGTLTVFEDYNTKFNVPFEDPYILTVTNSYGITQNFKVYRSRNMINGAMTITVK